MKNHLSSLHFLNYFRVEAVNGKEYSYDIDLSKGELGCTMSHIKAVEQFLESSYDFAIICEDDADFSNILNINIEDLELNIYDPFCLQTSVICRKEHTINFTKHKRSFWDFGTSSYIINKKYAKDLIEYYGTHLEIVWDKFISKSIFDERNNGLIITRPVADELVYSIGEVYCYPIFTFKNFNSTINKADEQHVQILTSIDKFNRFWGLNI